MTWDWVRALPWEAWSAFANWGTLVVGGLIAGLAARATWLQFHGTVQFELLVNRVDDLVWENGSAPGEAKRVTVVATNRTPFNITLASFTVRARQWALVSYPAPEAFRSGHDGFSLALALAPREERRWDFLLVGQNGHPDPFTLDVRWGRHGPAGGMSVTHVRGRF